MLDIHFFQPCYLQIHNMYSIARQIVAQPPLSIENAVGLIMVHGKEI